MGITIIFDLCSFPEMLFALFGVVKPEANVFVETLILTPG